MTTNNNRLAPIAFGLALGVLWGVSVLLMGLIAHFYEYGTQFVESMGYLYIGYTPSIAGSIIGGAIAFLDALIAGAILAGLYNLFCRCCCKKDGRCK